MYSQAPGHTTILHEPDTPKSLQTATSLYDRPHGSAGCTSETFLQCPWPCLRPCSSPTWIMTLASLVVCFLLVLAAESSSSALCLTLGAIITLHPIQGRAIVGLWLWVHKTQSLFLYYYLLVITWYSLPSTVTHFCHTLYYWCLLELCGTQALCCVHYCWNMPSKSLVGLSYSTAWNHFAYSLQDKAQTQTQCSRYYGCVTNYSKLSSVKQ